MNTYSMREHLTDATTMCWCLPKFEHVGDGVVVIHRKEHAFMTGTMSI